jgi:hypothetical protein
VAHPLGAGQPQYTISRGRLQALMILHEGQAKPAHRAAALWAYGKPPEVEVIAF